MKWELDDNSRSAFHYLMLGVLVVAVLVGLNAALDLFHVRIGPGGAFDHGYLISDDGITLIGADSARGERLVAGILVSVSAALGTSALVVAVCRLARIHDRRPTLFIARSVFLLSVIYTSYAALFLPLRQFIGQRDHNLVLWERAGLLGSVPCPGAKRIVLVPFDRVADVRTTRTPLTGERVRLRIECVLRNGDVLPLGDGLSSVAMDTSVLQFAEARISNLRRTIFGP